MTQQGHTIQNNLFQIDIDATSGAFSMIDKSCGRRWEADPWMGAAGFLTLETANGQQIQSNLSTAAEIVVDRQSDTTAKITFHRPATGAGERLAAEIVTRLTTPEEGGFRIEVLSVELGEKLSFVELEYPARLGALKTDVDDGYLVIPYWQGSLVPSTTGNFKKIPRVPFWAWDDMPWRDPGLIDLPTYEWQGISMPFYGVVNGKSAWVGIFETEQDVGIRCVLNANLQQKYDRVGKVTPFEQRLAVCSPYWRAEKGQFAYPRSMTIQLLPDGDYVDIAKKYRTVAKNKGLAISLDEKIDRNPNIDKIIGAPLVNVMGGYPWYIDYPAYRYTWSNVREIMDDMMKTVGLNRALMCLWIGYQKYPPNSYPFHPSNGTVEQLAETVKYGNKKNFLVCFYHGYPALLDHDPDFDVNMSRRINKHGEIHTRWGRNCSANFLSNAKANLPQSIRDSGQIADYTDMLTAGGLAECWDEQHGMTRTEDRRYKEELLEYINSLGLFTGSENARGWAVPYMAYAKNGGMGGSNPILNCHTVPLFNMVYKDCMVMYREHQAVSNDVMFADLAIGNHIQIHISWPGYYQSREGYMDVARVFQKFNRLTGRIELISHRFTEEFNGPYVTRFADGSMVRVNPTEDDRAIEGEQLKPRTAIITEGGGAKTRISPQQPRYTLADE